MLGEPSVGFLLTGLVSQRDRKPCIPWEVLTHALAHGVQSNQQIGHVRQPRSQLRAPGPMRHSIDIHEVGSTVTE